MIPNDPSRYTATTKRQGSDPRASGRVEKTNHDRSFSPKVGKSDRFPDNPPDRDIPRLRFPAEPESMNYQPPADDERCTATSKQNLRRCLRYHSPGMNVCYYHGGAAPQTKAKADEKLALMADRALELLADEMDQAQTSRDRIRAAIAVLDRAGFGALRRIELTPGSLDAEIARLEAELAEFDV